MTKKGERKRKDCRVCYKEEKKRKTTTFTCSAYPDKPGLYAVNYFDTYHRNLLLKSLGLNICKYFDLLPKLAFQTF